MNPLLLPTMVPPGDRELAELLIHFEGVRPAAYRDASGILTIGVGHRLPAALTGGEQGTPDISWSMDSIAAALADDIDAARRRVPDDLPVTDAQRDALAALAFNVGDIRRSQLCSLIRQEAELQAIVAEWVSWDHAHVAGGKRELRGLLLRRIAEAQWFVKEAAAGWPIKGDPA